jgi:hypothetical protein
MFKAGRSKSIFYINMASQLYNCTAGDGCTTAGETPAPRGSTTAG